MLVIGIGENLVVWKLGFNDDRERMFTKALALGSVNPSVDNVDLTFCT